MEQQNTIVAINDTPGMALPIALSQARTQAQKTHNVAEKVLKDILKLISGRVVIGSNDPIEKVYLSALYGLQQLKLVQDGKEPAAGDMELGERHYGRVDAVEFEAFGAISPQWTTIDGIRYATSWALYPRDWSTGSWVSFQAVRKLINGVLVLCAENIREDIPPSSIRAVA